MLYIDHNDYVVDLLNDMLHEMHHEMMLNHHV